MVALITGVFLSSVNVSADENTTDNVSVNVPVSCTMNGTGMTSHTASIPNGTYQSDIGTTTLQSFCNDSQGFAIYAIGYTNEEYGNTNLIGATQNQTIVTGTATTTGNPDVSNWAVKLATSSGATYPLTLDNSFGSYHNVPTEYTKVAHRDSGTDLGSSATGSTLTTTYAAYISKTQAADTYNGKVKYTLVHPASEVPAQPVACDPGRVCYNPNASTVIGQMGKQGSFNIDSVTLWVSNFKRDGYGFAGWNDRFDYSGNHYGPSQDIARTSDLFTDGLSLYAMWVKSADTMQNWTGCSSLASGTVTALTDSRDGNTYAVAKLADNRCWMIENLRFADNNNINLSSTTTHNPSLPLTNSWWYSSVNDNDTIPTSNHLSATTNPTQTAWCATVSSTCIDQSMLSTNNTTLYINNTTSAQNGNIYSYGNYYNWYSATAGHGRYGSEYGSNYTAPGDICPVGWHLPTGKDASGEFGLLDVALGGTGGATDSETEGTAMSQIYRSYPNNFVYSGGVSGSSITNRNSFGTYWTASGSIRYTAYYAYFSSNGTQPGVNNNGYKYNGYPVRCISDV